MAEYGPLRDSLALAKCGVPWDVVMGLESDERKAMVIAAGMNEGAEYDWDADNWISKNA